MKKRYIIIIGLLVVSILCKLTLGIKRITICGTVTEKFHTQSRDGGSVYYHFILREKTRTEQIGVCIEDYSSTEVGAQYCYNDYTLYIK